MRDVVDILVSWGLTTTLIFVLVHWDERRLSPEQLARAWPVASRRAAIVFFGVFSLPVHFWRTRRSWAGRTLGWVAGLAIAVVADLVASAIAGLFPP
jgi:hypothetical protein